jgi:hypothetical protein
MRYATLSYTSRRGNKVVLDKLPEDAVMYLQHFLLPVLVDAAEQWEIVFQDIPTPYVQTTVAAPIVLRR